MCYGEASRESGRTDGNGKFLIRGREVGERVGYGSENRRRAFVRPAFRESPAFKEDNAAFNACFEPQRDLRIEAVPGIDFDRTDSDLARSSVKLAVGGF